MLVPWHSGGLALSRPADRPVLLLHGSALPSLGLIDNGFISYLVYLLMLFKVIFVLAAAKATAEKNPALDSCSNSDLFALFFLFRLLFGFNLLVSPLNGLEITRGFLVQQAKG